MAAGGASGPEAAAALTSTGVSAGPLCAHVGAVTVTRGRLKHARLPWPEMLQLTSSQPFSLASSRYRLISPAFPTTEQKWSHFGTDAP